MGTKIISSLAVRVQIVAVRVQIVAVRVQIVAVRFINIQTKMRRDIESIIAATVRIDVD